MMSCTSYERTAVYVNSSRNHALSHTLASRRFAASIAAACILGLGATTGAVVAAPAAHALPGGMSVEDARAAISSPISVPAVKTTTVSMHVSANASNDVAGW